MEPEHEENIKLGFYTATILDWKKLLMPDKYKEIIVGSLKFMVDQKMAKVYAFVIMPNHLHLIWIILKPWTLKEVQRDFMKYTSQMIKFDLAKNHQNVLELFYVGAKDRKYQFWQRNSLIKFLPSREITEQKMDYIHNNPVQGKWMLADDPLHYRYSSIRFYEEDNDEFGFLTHYMEYFE